MFCPPWIDETQPEVTFGVGEETRRFVVDLAQTAEVRETYSKKTELGARRTELSDAPDIEVDLEQAMIERLQEDEAASEGR